MNAPLQSYINEVIHEFDLIPSRRKEALAEIADLITLHRKARRQTDLVFICTHNSRRSHMSQLWAAAGASFYGKTDHLNTYSGGTEATAFHPNAVAAMRRAGFQINEPGGTNPQYQVRWSEESEPLLCFSKKYDHPVNPSGNFLAIMVCSDADKNCPVVPGAEARFTLPYSDPKEADGTEREAQVYDLRCRQIATEMMYLFSLVR